MAHRNGLLVWILLVGIITACGPDTIFLRPALDTPEQHVKNGHNLLARNKIDAAWAEFERAKSLDAGYAPAYVGLALVQARQGDVDGGLLTLQQAKSLVTTAEQGREVDDCIQQLKGMP